MSDALSHDEAQKLLVKESELLDNKEYSKWLQMLTEDVTYKIPVRQTREKGSDDEFTEMYHLNDNRYRIEKRIQRFESEFAWAEDPPTRTRHFVTNVRVKETNSEDVPVISNLLLSWVRGDDPDPEIISAEREDRLRYTDNGWKICERVVLLDQTVLPIHNISVFF